MTKFCERFLMLYTESQEKGIKRSEFANQCGATENQIQGWIRGTSEPNTEFLGRIAKGLEVNLYWLLGLSDIRDAAIVEIQGSLRNLTKQQATYVKIFIQFIEYLEKNKKQFLQS